MPYENYVHKSRCKLIRILLIAAACQLVACSVLQKPPVEKSSSQVEEKRHSASELQAYQAQNFSWPDASLTGAQTRLDLERKKLHEVFSPAFANALEDALPAALNAVMLFNIEVKSARAPLLNAIPNLPNKPVDYQRQILTAAYALFPAESAPLVSEIMPQLSTPREFSIAAYTVLKAQKDASEILKKMLSERFPGDVNEPRLIALKQTLDRHGTSSPAISPPLKDLLIAPFKPGLPVIFSLQRTGRKNMGLALIRAADGHFVRDEQGHILAIAQLALALNGLPGTITNGNTPQGVFTIRGAGTATNPWIGPTPYLHSKLPIEASVAEFLHQEEQGQVWNEATYQSLVPPSWRLAMSEAWLAGLAGRNDILIHGTTVNPDNYRGASFFPGTPTAGCLATSEYWSPVDGQLIKSDQLNLAKAFSVGGLDSGYLVVAEIDTGLGQVTLEEVLQTVFEAEKIVISSPKQ
jgi:hypothetical protein